MPYPNVHSGRVRNPDDFIEKSYRTKQIAPGISIIVAKLKSDGNKGPMTGQAYRFDKDKFTADEAKKWLKKNKIKTILFEPAVQQAKEATVDIIGDSVFERCLSSVMDKKKKKMMMMTMEAGGEVVASSSNLTNDGMNGSIEKKMDLIRSSLKDSLLFGKWPRVLATYNDYVFVEAEFDGPKVLTRFFKVPYTMEGDTVKLGTATEIEKVTKFVVKEMTEDIIKGLFVEGGPGSGNFGHKGRPGHRGGALPGGSGKGSRGKGGGGGTAPHVVGIKGGQKVKAAQFYDKSGNIKTSGYKKLTDNQKGQVLKHGLQKYTESYVPKAKQEGMKESALAVNRKVGEIEGVAVTEK